MKEKIQQTASILFLNLGFKSVTMDDIAEKMGISKKTIYEYYKNKSALVKATTHYVFEQINKKVDKICCTDCNTSAIHTLFHMNDFLLKHLKEDNAPEYQLQKYYPKIAASLTKKKFTSITEGITKNLEKGIKNGLYRNDIDVAVIARLYYSTVSSIKSSDIFPTETYKISKVMHIFLLYHIRAIATPKGLKELEHYLKKNT